MNLPFNFLYSVKLDLVDLWAFQAPCAVIVELSAKLKDLDNCAKFGVFIRYKNRGGGYRVWGLEWEGVVKLWVELKQRQLALPPFTTLSTLVLTDHLSRQDPWTIKLCICQRLYQCKCVCHHQ